MSGLPPILMSGSAYKTWLMCPRARYHGYERLNDDGSRGLERKRLNLPLSTGGWCHKVAQGLLEGAMIGQVLPVQQQPAAVIAAAREGYLNEVRTRGLELGLSLDGAIAEERFTERTIAEQAALIEAFRWAYVRVRLPRLLEEYEVLDVEREEMTVLSGDVGLQSRCDAVLRRKSDGHVFIYNLKTTASPDKRWSDTFEYDQQMMTETIAVERRLNKRVYGVIIDGFDKGQRVNVWWWNLKEIREGQSKPPAEGDEKWQGQRSRLLYGYKCEDIPGRPVMYDYEGTTRKGWGRFAVWEEQFAQDFASARSPIEYWINWLPIEQVESAFITLPPIMRSDEHMNAKVRQMARTEQDVRLRREAVEACPSELDALFPQHDGFPCLRCEFRQLCWEDGGDVHYQPRVANHPMEVSE